MRIIIIILIATFIVSCSTTKTPQSFDNQILSLILSKGHKEGNYTVVKANASAYLWPQSEERIDQTCRWISEVHKDIAIDTCPLIKRLFEKNSGNPLLTLKSNKASGYVIDKSGQFMHYFSENGGGWKRWYQENPNAKCFTTISLPVFDERSGLVAMYIGKQCHGLVGAGSFVFYTYFDGQLVEKYRVGLWVS
jgi:hypothetical protein